MSRCGSSGRGTDVSSERALICFIACLSLSFGPGVSLTDLAVPCVFDCAAGDVCLCIGGSSGSNCGSSRVDASRERARSASADGALLP